MRLSLSERLRARAALAAPGPKLELTRARGALSVSFDDFPKTAWTEAGPILACYGVRATYYVSGGREGGFEDGVRHFDLEDLCALHAAGHEVGCHTFDHLSALQHSPAAFEASIARSARYLAERLDGWRPRSFAYPYGDVSLGGLRVTARHFASARIGGGGLNRGAAKRFALAAVPLERARPPAGGWEAVIAEAAQQKAWVIAVTHDVREPPADWGCGPDDLDRVLRLATEAGLEIAPVGDIVAGGKRPAPSAEGEAGIALEPA